MTLTYFKYFTITNRAEALDCLKFIQLAFKHATDSGSYPKRIDQGLGFAYRDSKGDLFGGSVFGSPGDRMEEECGRCIGFWIAYILDLEGAVSIHDGKPMNFISYTDGCMAFRTLLSFFFKDVDCGEDLLTYLARYTGKWDVFGERPWDRPPAKVFDELIQFLEDEDYKPPKLWESQHEKFRNGLKEDVFA